MTTPPPPPTPVPTTNAGAQDAVTVLENLGQMGETAAETAIIADAPFMGTPVLKQIWEAIFEWVCSLILKPIASFGGRVVISIEQFSALNATAAAQVALKQAQQAGNVTAIATASAEVDLAVAKVVQYVGQTKA